MRCAAFFDGEIALVTGGYMTGGVVTVDGGVGLSAL